MADKNMEKDPKRQLLGVAARKKGQFFEQRIDATFDYYRERGYALIEKTPEPMKPIRSIGQGRFVACYVKKAQADYKGTMKGGRTLIFEAKYTDSDRMTQDRVSAEQHEYMEKHAAIGARCYVVVGFRSGNVYRIPFNVWKNMKNRFGRKYVTESDLDEYRVEQSWNGTLLLLA